MKNLTPIVAYSREGRVIGINDEIPFQLFSDKIHFKKTTKGHSVISGRKSYEAIPDEYRPLEDRDNIIVSHNHEYIPSIGDIKISDTTKKFVFHTLEGAINFADGLDDDKEIYIIGGGEIYNQVMQNFDHRIKKIIATEVEGDFEGDTFFPEINLEDWDRVVIKTVPAEPGKNSHPFTIVHYLRKEIA